MWSAAALIVMDDRWSILEHVAQTARIRDQMDFSNPGVLALCVNEISDRTADTTLATLDNMGNLEECRRRLGAKIGILVCRCHKEGDERQSVFHLDG